MEKKGKEIFPVAWPQIVFSGRNPTPERMREPLSPAVFLSSIFNIFNIKQSKELNRTLFFI